jgi:hypothetical protein
MSHHPLLIVKARHIIRHSHLSDVDKQLMFERLPYLDAGMLALFIQSAEENPFAIDAIAKSMKRKLDTRGNLHHLHQVLEEEAKEIIAEEDEEVEDSTLVATH